MELLKRVRATASNERTATFVAIQSRNSYAEVASAAHFIIEKRILAESFDRTLRVAQPMMLPERRRYYRLPLQAPVTVARGPGQELFNGVSLNISESGMALRSEVCLSQREIISLQVSLPEFAGALRWSAEVVWANSQGLAGTRFLSFKGKAKEMLSAWIQKGLEQEGPIPQSVSE